MAIYNFEEQKPKKKKTDYQKIVGCILVAVSIICLFCLITRFVPFMKSFLLGTAGLFCYPLFITLMAVGFALVGHKKYVMPKKYGVLLCLSVIFVLSILQLILVKNDGLNFWQYITTCYTQKTTAGGIILGIVTAPVLYLLNRLGAYIIFIALSLIFVALTIDYIHYLSKNENLKKAIKVLNSPEQVSSIPAKITVKELENNLKSSVLNNTQTENKEQVKITLNAKQEQETTEEAAKRKLGLLASSKQDLEDNSRYFNTEIENEVKIKPENTREYLLSGKNDKIELSKYSSNQLNKIQANFMNLKNKSFDDETITPTINLNDMPSKVIHEDISTIIPSTSITNVKSTIGNTDNVESNIKPKVNIIEDNLTINEPIKIQPIPSQIIEEKQHENTLDVENFTNNILASLNKETKQETTNTSSYISSTNMFKEEPSQVSMPIVPKEPIVYVKPPIELLTTQSMDLSLMNQDVVMKREELEIALDTFGIPAKVIGVVIGPAVTRYELEMPAGVSIKRLLALQEDIAYNLSSNGDIRIEAPIPGRRAVGIEVPNEKIATVGLRDIILSREFMEAKANLSIALGKDISGAVKTFSLIKVPHLLIAGTTGSGKSVCINAIILSLIYRYSPDEVKFILVDPKRVEFSMYNNLPHLLTPNVITDSEKALNALSWCVDEMERRFIVFANARVKNLEEYNHSEEVLEGRAEKMPYIIFIIDELADLLMTAKKEAEEHICRILQKARAAGIHMILATQRPSVDIVTGKIKANLSARICFALMTFADSKTVLDQGGADKLLGKGDMLFMSSDTGVPKRIQGCFVTTKEIDDIVTYVKENNGDYEFDMKTEQSILNPPKKDVVTQIDGDRASNDGFDALMPQVLKSVIESGHASISMIQRKFLVGFPRAARIIDQMEEAGYISPSDGSKSRSVYMTMEEYDKLYGEG
ncbi:MAG: DUF87 domain-containing protein [Clostridiales bacterium]|nr:DUF87 domain-containing protein [Clostridiales bacterium]